MTITTTVVMVMVLLLLLFLLVVVVLLLLLLVVMAFISRPVSFCHLFADAVLCCYVLGLLDGCSIIVSIR